mmetsp:Transcript_27529/g.84434  ORF Transcript_27529/g.84434 Transcript_27529/m.84434 type:complete len:281 (-) Transcript_27529:455-1297(-)
MPPPPDEQWYGRWFQPKYESGIFFTIWKCLFDREPLRLTDDEPENRYNNVNYSPYRRGEEPKPFVVYDNNEKPEPLARADLAVRDSHRKGRYFVGKQVGKYPHTESLIGGVFYFDDDGKRRHHELFPVELFDYDHRNGRPTDENAFFCDDVVCFVWAHRDYPREIRVKGFKISERDGVTGSFELQHRCKQHYWLEPPDVIDGPGCAFRLILTTTRRRLRVSTSSLSGRCRPPKKARSGVTSRATASRCATCRRRTGSKTVQSRYGRSYAEKKTATDKYRR